jgi:hypothetical protein
VDSEVCRVRAWDVHIKIETSTLKGRQKGKQKGTEMMRDKNKGIVNEQLSSFLLHFSSVFNPHEKETL